MKNKYMRFWFFLFLITLMVISGTASFFASQKNLYQGLEIVQPKNISKTKASLLHIPQQEGISDSEALVRENEARINRLKPQKPQEPVLEKGENEEVGNKNPCGKTGIPIMSNSTIVGCRFE